MADLLEREEELGRIADLIAAARGGTGGMLLIEGPAGIGKTELVEAARSHARDAGLQLASARGAELESDFPFGVVRQLYDPVLAAATGRDRRSLLAGAAEEAPFVIGGGGARPEQQAQTFSALHSLYWLSVNVAAQRPLVVTVDDVHWADSQSLRFLAYLRPRLEGVPLLAIVALRTGDPPSDPGLLEQLTGGRDGIEVLRPEPLSGRAVAEVVGEGLGVAPDPPFVAACTSATGGNPFLLRELVGALVADATAPVQASAPQVEGLGTRNVARSILRRIGRLGPASGALAQALAVLGGEALLRDAAALAELEERAAADAADALVAAEVVEPGRPLVFVHPLVRSAVYNDLAPSARAAAHARAADVLERHGSGSDAIAAHLVETEPAGRSEVARRLHEAANQALERGAPEVAARYLRRALLEPPPESVRGELLRALGVAELDSGRLEDCAEHFFAALPLIEAGLPRVQAALMLRQCLVLTSRVPEAVEALDFVKAHSEPEWAPLLEAGAVGAALLDTEAAGRWGERALALRASVTPDKSDDPFVLAVAAAAGAYANNPRDDDLPLALAALERAGEIVEGAVFSGLGYLGAALTVLESFDEAIDVCTRAVTRRGSLPLLVSALGHRSRAFFRVGRLAEAGADALNAIEAAGLYHQGAYIPLVWSGAADVLVEQGELEEADRLELAAGLDDRPLDLWYVTLAINARARLRMAQGRPRDALADVARVRARLSAPALRSPSLMPWRSDTALMHLALGEVDEARALAEEEVVLARHFGAPRALGVALRAAALAGEGPDQIDRLSEAESVLAGSPAELEHARVLTDLGAALRRANRRSDARDPLRRALDVASRVGATVLADRAAQELAATGARPQRARLRGADSLTPSERRIAEMAAGGRSNVEIAQDLFLTRRTVETHLTHAYQKLDIASRHELAAALAEPAGTAAPD